MRGEADCPAGRIARVQRDGGRWRREPPERRDPHSPESFDLSPAFDVNGVERWLLTVNDRSFNHVQVNARCFLFSGTFPVISSQVQRFQTEVATAAAILDPKGDYVPHLLPLLAASDEHVRMMAAMESRYFLFTQELRVALLARVRGDNSFDVRMQAA
jgi:hypothetical protein